MESLFLYTLYHSKWAKSMFDRYAKEGWLLDPKEKITEKTLIRHRNKHWKNLNNPRNTNIISDLRQFKNSSLLTIMTRDYLKLSDLSENLSSISSLAEICIQCAYESAVSSEINKIDSQINQDSDIPDLIIIAMGKLGGNELNPASDIDLIFSHTKNGVMSPTKNSIPEIDSSYFFSKVVNRICEILSWKTFEGIVFRVDLRLRPHGDFGPKSISIDGLEKYFRYDALPWERFAWVKAKVINQPFLQNKKKFNYFVSKLNDLKENFVYRPYPDYRSIDSIRTLHEKIKSQHILTKEKRTGTYIFNVKLENGGIRDIEFLIQFQQLIRGGKENALRSPSTLRVLKELHRLDFISSEHERLIYESYGFWRRIEHHLQYALNEQTHTVTTDNIKDIERSFNYSNSKKLRLEIKSISEKIMSLFKKSLSLKKAIETPLPSISKKILKSKIEKSPDSYESVKVTNDLLSFLKSQSQYSKMLKEYPHIIEKISEISSKSVWLCNYIKKHPEILDQLLKTSFISNEVDFKKIKKDLDLKLDFSFTEEKVDFEKQIDDLRQFHHEILFRLLCQDHEKKFNIQDLSDKLTELADLVLDATLKCVWRSFFYENSEPEVAVIAFGKLGAREFGFASDLDLIFLTNSLDDNQHASLVKVIKRFISWLTVSTSAGNLFKIDLRLRPNGNSGLLITSLKSFSEYQTKKAWLWEHQAITKSRFCAGNKSIGMKFESVRKEILQKQRPIPEMLEEIVAMRNKIQKQHKSLDEFDIKYHKGGMIDVEFLVQATILRYSKKFPSLCKNIGTINLLRDFGEKGILPSELSKKVSYIYAEYRSIQHNLRLKNMSEKKFNVNDFKDQINTVNKLWDKVFKEAPKVIRKLSEINKHKRIL